MQLTLGGNFGWVIATAVGSVLVVNGWMSVQVGKARKKYGVLYPTMYADKATCKDADAFNCVQRGHQNTLENFPAFLALLTLSGITYPVASSVAGLVWILGRIAYFNGYATGDPKARMKGGFNHFGMLGLVGLAIASAVHLIRSQ